MAANSPSKPLLLSHYNDLLSTPKAIEKKRIRTPLPRKRLFPVDAYSPDADLLSELDGPTPRPRNYYRIYPVPKLLYIEALATFTDDIDGDSGMPQPLRSRI